MSMPYEKERTISVTSTTIYNLSVLAIHYGRCLLIQFWYWIDCISMASIRSTALTVFGLVNFTATTY